mgnify:CR=1 FL=1
MSGGSRFLRALGAVLVCVAVFLAVSFGGVLLALQLYPGPSDLVPVSYVATVFLAALTLGVLAATGFSRRYTRRHTPRVVLVQAPPAPAPAPTVPVAPPPAPAAPPKTPKADPTDGLAKWAKVEYQLSSIDLMEGHDFEAWAAEVLREMGFRRVQVTQASGDQGVDVLAEKDGIRYAVQCKRYTADLGNTPIQEVHAGKDYYHCHVGVVLTNRYFTASAKALAAQTGTLLWDRDWIKRRLQSGQGLKYIPPQE